MGDGVDDKVHPAVVSDQMDDLGADARTPCSPTTPSHWSTKPAAATRAINNLAPQVLIAAFINNKTIVDQASARTAVTAE